ncbi:MAG TPA: class I SAM-dependent methyltransferase [Methanocella sp.]|uniref:SAM-dependent methyltransferase n=1 Tax=Methanocella sp. TaxID=2052833 RepID=UPI002CD5ABBD|nr:class I SAM-dependent methyltransferase [Methanocella sp.]HTY91850.1 class I SAM-dependent methyltransferase [Methanocella sp.]
MITDDFDYLAPGGRSYTLAAGQLARLKKSSRVLEIACGRGEAACALAEAFKCRVDAFDIDPVMVEYSMKKAEKLGLGEYTNFFVKDGRDMDFGEGKYDLILAEGGALTYIGREEGIAHSADLLKEGRCLALTDLIYLRDDVPQPVRDAYEEGVCSYLTEIRYRKLLEAYDFEIMFASMLPQSAWDRYYAQMRRQVMSPKNKFTRAFKDSMMREIDVYYNYGGMFSIGYFYAVARLSRKKRVKPAGEGLRIPLAFSYSG